MSIEETNAKVYDYKIIRTTREMEVLTSDSYANLGYNLISSKIPDSSMFYVELSFKRNREIGKNIEMTKIERKLDASLNQIKILERKRKNAGMIPGLSVGTIGLIIMVVGILLCFLVDPTNIGWIIGGAIIAVVGLAVGLSGFLVHHVIQRNTQDGINQKIESETDKLAEACEAGAKIVANQTK